jgi:exopolysaccharide biosynthesis predicted pyruvyltransferase EpsI
VHLKQAKWSPTPNSSICSTHFSKEDFTGIFSSHSGKRPHKATDEVGIVDFPKYANTGEDMPLYGHAKRMVCIQLYYIIQIIY